MTATNGNKVNFLTERDGKPSATRLTCFISLLAAIVFGGLTIYAQFKGGQVTDGVIITFGFLLGAFAPNSLNKFITEKVKT